MDGWVRLIVVSPTPGDPPHGATVGQKLGMGSPTLVLDVIRNDCLKMEWMGCRGMPIYFLLT